MATQGYNCKTKSLQTYACTTERLKKSNKHVKYRLSILICHCFTKKIQFLKRNYFILNFLCFWSNNFKSSDNNKKGALSYITTQKVCKKKKQQMYCFINLILKLYKAISNFKECKQKHVSKHKNFKASFCFHYIS